MTGGLGSGRKGRFEFVPEAKPAGPRDDPLGDEGRGVLLELGPEHTTVRGAL